MAVTNTQFLIQNGGELDTTWFPSHVTPTDLLDAWISASPYASDDSTEAFVYVRAYRFLERSAGASSASISEGGLSYSETSKPSGYLLDVHRWLRALAGLESLTRSSRTVRIEPVY